MKRLVIACILILALTSQAYAMGWMGGKGGGGGSSGKATSSGTSNSATGSTTGSAANNTNNGPTSLVAGGTEGQQRIVGSTPNGNGIVSTPELTTMFLLGSGLFGLWGLRRKIKK